MMTLVLLKTFQKYLLILICSKNVAYSLSVDI